MNPINISINVLCTIMALPLPNKALSSLYKLKCHLLYTDLIANIAQLNITKTYGKQ